MAQLSPKVKEKNAEKWEKAITPDLYDGEAVWAFIGASKSKPTTTGTAITNARVIGLCHFQQGEKRVPVEVSADQILSVEFPERLGVISANVITREGSVEFGHLHKDEVEFARYYIEYLRDKGTDPVVRDNVAKVREDANAVDLQRRDRLARRRSIPVFGSEMKDKWWDSAASHAHEADELPWFVINSGMEGRLFAFEDRLVISKTGAMTSWMAGSLGGGRETVFPFTDITNIEYNSGFVNGVVEVLTPSYQGSANHDYWRSSHKGRNKASDDPRTLSNCLPLTKQIYKEALPSIQQMQRKIMDTKRPQVVVQQSVSASPEGGLAHELEKLADMHQRGLLDAGEFKAAKLAAIAKMS